MAAGIKIPLIRYFYLLNESPFDKWLLAFRFDKSRLRMNMHLKGCIFFYKKHKIKKIQRRIQQFRYKTAVRLKRLRAVISIQQAFSILAFRNGSV